MATEQQHMVTLPTAQLWIGSEEILIAHAHTFMQQRWCAQGGCTRCPICTMITQHQYHSAMWITPDGNYTKETLEDVFQTMQFQMDENRELIFVIKRADYLTSTCYNSLLKSIEEPPRGYHFLFFAQRIKEVAPTIRSRCIIKNFEHQHDDISKHPLVQFFTQTNYQEPQAFLTALEDINPDEHESTELINALLLYWITQYKKAIAESNQRHIIVTERTMAILEKHVEEPPMSGSSKLFWKNLFVQLKD